MALHIIDHPLVQHKLSIMRDKETSTMKFRELLQEIAMLMGYEITRDLPLTYEDIETPLMPMRAPKIAGKKVVIVPILRAGLGMVDGLMKLMPSARIGHIGMYRDEETCKPVFYYYKMPSGKERLVLLTDPMLATGKSFETSYRAYLNNGTPSKLHIVAVVASEQGVAYLKDCFASDDVTLWCAVIDPELNNLSYIVPGLGDCGDLCYGEKL